MSFAAAMLIGLVLDVVVGWPDALFRRIGHPVTWMGSLITLGERVLNRGDAARRRANGVTLVIVVVGLVVAVTGALAALVPSGWFGVVITGLLAWPFVAARALQSHVAAVAAPLVAGDLDGARAAVAMVVGRSPDTMDGAAIARAGLESLAENTSDGVVAPLFWGAIFGLPGIAGYKAINTLDSMIGYRNARYENFGWAAARLDDGINLLPARLTGGLIALAATGARRVAFRTMMRDARRHRSPNAGWPEAAMAGALAVRLSGPRVYDDVATDDPWLNAVAGDPRPEDMKRGLRLFRRAVLLSAFGLAALALI
ncbi:MAG: adenosylcobinamide-phosphate synthase CbiB [Pseudomonadota bacterium]